MSILLTLVVSILPTLVVLATLVESILPTLVVSARAATGWLVGSCRPHVARDGARTTISQKMITIIQENISQKMIIINSEKNSYQYFA